MFNHDVINYINWIFSIFDIKLVSFISSLFAIYFAWHKLTKKVSALVMMNASSLYDLHISSVVISNKRDNTITITKIFCQFPDGKKLELKSFESPMIIKGYDTKKIDLEKYSFISHMGNQIEINPFDKISIFLVEFSGKVRYCETERNPRLDIENAISKTTRKFNGIILTSRIKYIFTYKVNGEVRNAIININGFIDGDLPFHFNCINIKNATDDIKYSLINLNYHSSFEDYKLFAVSDFLICTLVLHKNEIQQEIDEKLNLH